MKIVTLCAAFVLAASSASAQNRGHPPRMRGVRPPPNAGNEVHRNELEQRFRQRTEQVVRQRLNLNEDQLSRLRSVNADIGTKRNTLVEQERSLRSGLRDEMAKGSGADQSKIAQLMAQAHDLQVRRFALQQDEQKQLSDFMSPIQVAQYVGLQAQIRQRVREMQRGQQPDQPNPNP